MSGRLRLLNRAFDRLDYLLALAQDHADRFGTPAPGEPIIRGALAALADMARRGGYVPAACTERVYVIATSDMGPFKVGRSRDPEQRMRQLQTGHPERLGLRFVHRAPRWMESAMHNALASSRMEGEWFGCEFDSIWAWHLAMDEIERCELSERHPRLWRIERPCRLSKVGLPPWDANPLPSVPTRTRLWEERCR